MRFDPAAAAFVLKGFVVAASVPSPRWGTPLESTLRIPTEAGHPFRREAGQRSDLMSATIPR
jgi:hypothetical protein